MYRFRLLIANLVLLFAVAGAMWARSVDGAVLQNADFLKGVELPFRDWTHKDSFLEKGDLAMLQPDSYLMRRYTAPTKEWIDLAVIAGHKKRSVHNPGFCMAGGGWEMLSQTDCTLKVGGKDLPAVRIILTKGGAHIVATYLFTNGVNSTSSATRFAVTQLMRRFTTKIPVGALVRILAPVGRSPEAAIARSEELAAATLPTVLRSIREAQANVR